MTFEFAVQALDHLGKTHFNRSWPKDSIEVVFPEIQDFSNKSMTEAVKRVRIEISPSTFPALKRITDILKEEQQKINLASSPDEPKSRRDNDKAFQSVFGQRASEHSKHAINLCMRIADGDMAPDKIIAYCGRMEREFPGVGWRETELYFIKRHNADDYKTASTGGG